MNIKECAVIKVLPTLRQGNRNAGITVRGQVAVRSREKSPRSVAESIQATQTIELMCHDHGTHHMRSTASAMVEASAGGPEHSDVGNGGSRGQLVPSTSSAPIRLGCETTFGSSLKRESLSVNPPSQRFESQIIPRETQWLAAIAVTLVIALLAIVS